MPKQKAPTADRITEIQTALAQGGYYHGDANGKWDSSTVAALEKFQSANGIEPTGKLDAPSLEKLGLGSDTAGISAPKPITPAGPGPETSVPSEDNAPKPAAPPSASAGAADTTAANNPQQAGSNTAASPTASIAPSTAALDGRAPQK